MIQPETDIDRRMRDDDGLITAVQDSRRDALRRHAQAGVPVVVWRNGKVVELPPDIALAQRHKRPPEHKGSTAA